MLIMCHIQRTASIIEYFTEMVGDGDMFINESISKFGKNDWKVHLKLHKNIQNIYNRLS